MPMRLGKAVKLRRSPAWVQACAPMLKCGDKEPAASPLRLLRARRRFRRTIGKVDIRKPVNRGCLGGLLR